jgi:hypothetical protein
VPSLSICVDPELVCLHLSADLNPMSPKQVDCFTSFVQIAAPCQICDIFRIRRKRTLKSKPLPYIEGLTASRRTSIPPILRGTSLLRKSQLLLVLLLSPSFQCFFEFRNCDFRYDKIRNLQTITKR